MAPAKKQKGVESLKVGGAGFKTLTHKKNKYD
jgi:hypothetical protein